MYQGVSELQVASRTFRADPRADESKCFLLLYDMSLVASLQPRQGDFANDVRGCSRFAERSFETRDTGIFRKAWSLVNFSAPFGRYVF
jgi:hypothetical protein